MHAQWQLSKKDWIELKSLPNRCKHRSLFITTSLDKVDKR